MMLLWENLTNFLMIHGSAKKKRMDKSVQNIQKVNFNLYPECKYSGVFLIFLKCNDCTSELNRKQMVLFGVLVCGLGFFYYYFGVGFGFFLPGNF